MAAYFIQAGEGGPVKIGYAADPAARLRELQTANAARLVLLGTAPGGRDVERFYHELLAPWRLEGEWFSPSPEVLAEAMSAFGGLLLRGKRRPAPRITQRILDRAVSLVIGGAP